MKAIILSFLLAASSLLAADGVFYVDKPVEAHLIAQSGATTTNHLIGGSTTMVGTGLTELCPTEKTTIYLSGGPVVEADANSILSINTFDQEVKNLMSSPCRAEFGSHNISLMLTKGTFSIFYPIHDTNSICAVSTPTATCQMNVGKFFFKISDESSTISGITNKSVAPMAIQFIVIDGRVRGIRMAP